MKPEKCYELNPSQEVVMLQLKFCLHKRIVNIISSITSDNKIDFNIMQEAFNKVVERNDCLRLRFFKKKGKLMQYFIDQDHFNNIPQLKFNTQAEQDAFIKKLRKSPIKYLKGKVIEPYFINTYDGKDMILIKVCHLILDIYGINMIFKDLFDVYDALINNKPLPQQLNSFEEIIKKDLSKKNNSELTTKNKEFFTKYLQEREQPWYAGIHGTNSKIWQKQLKRKRQSMPMFLINSDTEGYIHKLDENTCKNMLKYCKDNHFSVANFMFYTMSICASKTNNNVKNMLPLELCNCRSNAFEKNCAGTKVQSIACYTTLDENKNFKENLEAFSLGQMRLYRYMGFSDSAFQMLLHKTYNSSLLETYYSIAFSFIPYKMPEHLHFKLYSNGKCALPAYIALLYNTDKEDIRIAYDCQTKIITEKEVEIFHKNYTNIINQIVSNPDIELDEIVL